MTFNNFNLKLLTPYPGNNSLGRVFMKEVHYQVTNCYKLSQFDIIAFIYIVPGSKLPYSGAYKLQGKHELHDKPTRLSSRYKDPFQLPYCYH